ncbi:DUF11 domain-containing protein [Actinomadura barringtoniae]|uniref:DUF11 domain-containing protein n=1 Tax=Actinomadura barringtoniae TaxID=1427535 RepID=A0A939T7M2_9ACTN|nr:DUF11 domain-containing protein [Actinomadura barringtoniae]MBO2446020.1 DUF11 domain-containing protein [Actinomadura barringtoniae]
MHRTIIVALAVSLTLGLASLAGVQPARSSAHRADCPPGSGKDCKAGVLANTVVSDDGGCPAGSTAPDCASSVGVERVEISKKADKTEAGPGDKVTYTVTVANTGTVAVTGRTFTDDLTKVLDDAVYDRDARVTKGAVRFASPKLIWTGDLAAGATATITYSVKLKNPVAGDRSLVNVLTPANPGDCEPGACTSTVTIPPDPSIKLTKSVSPTNPVLKVGLVLTYSFAVTNTGNVALTDVTVTETAFSGSGTPPKPTCPAKAAKLLPGATVTCSGTYTVTQADVDAGKVTNAATATGTPPGTIPPPTSPPSQTKVPADPAPALTIAKSASPKVVHAPGERVTYTFLVTNTGNVTLTGVSVREDAFSGTGRPGPVTCPETTLAVGTSMTCAMIYKATQADMGLGAITNTASATGEDPGGGTVTSPPDGSEVKVVHTPLPGVVLDPPSLKLVKSATPALGAAGTRIRYRFTVTNTGGTTVENVAIRELSFSGGGKRLSPTCPAAARSLDPGEAVTCTATYTVTRRDVRRGKIVNRAVATGEAETGARVTSPPSAAVVRLRPPGACRTLGAAGPATASRTVGADRAAAVGRCRAG